MGLLVWMSGNGDEQLAWDPADKESVKKAYDQYAKLKKEGFEFFTVEESKGRKVTRFDKKLGKIIAAPGGRTTADKEAGRRTRGMAGGPTLRSE